MKIAVTGAAGFIGSHLVPALAGAGHLVTRIVKPGSEIPGGTARSISADIVSGEGMSTALDGTDGVIHLAARNHALKETEKEPLSAYRRVNVEGTWAVIRAAAMAGARWFIHFSSVKAIGEGGDEVFDEDSPCHPTTPYGISKLESEEVVRRAAKENGLGAIIFRLPLVYGPGNAGNLPRMIRWADRGLPFPLHQPDNLRSMVYIGNVVAGVMAILGRPPDGISIYILKDREEYSTRRIYSAICRELGKKPRFLPVPSAVVKVGGMISGDFRKITGAFRVRSAKIEQDIGFMPPFSLEEGLARTVQWYRHSVR